MFHLQLHLKIRQAFCLSYFLSHHEAIPKALLLEIMVTRTHFLVTGLFLLYIYPEKLKSGTYLKISARLTH